jgi:murein L,D-transpeptidase YafK
VKQSAQKGRLLWAVAGTACAAVIALAFVSLQASQGAVIDGPADRIVVEKQAHTLTLFRQGKVLKTYRVALGRSGAGPKLQAGDNRVPEGVYRIVGRNPHSAFHRALRVGYPTPEQVRQAQARGIDPGGDIMVHGIRNGLGWLGSLQRQVDWTKGCIAVTDGEIDEIWRLVPDGTPIEIDR